MKTLLTLTFTALLALPSYAAQETHDVQVALDVHVAQNNATVQKVMQEELNKDILKAVNNFRIPMFTSSLDLLANNTRDEFNGSAETKDIE